MVVEEEPATCWFARLEKLQQHDTRAEVLGTHHKPGEVECVLAIPEFVGVELFDLIFQLGERVGVRDGCVQGGREADRKKKKREREKITVITLTIIKERHLSGNDIHKHHWEKECNL